MATIACLSCALLGCGLRRANGSSRRGVDGRQAVEDSRSYPSGSTHTAHRKGEHWFAVGIKIAVLILVFFGVATMWMAVFADVGVTVLAVLNAARTLK